MVPLCHNRLISSTAAAVAAVSSVVRCRRSPPPHWLAAAAAVCAGGCGSSVSGALVLLLLAQQHHDGVEDQDEISPTTTTSYLSSSSSSLRRRININNNKQVLSSSSSLSPPGPTGGGFLGLASFPVPATPVNRCYCDDEQQQQQSSPPPKPKWSYQKRMFTKSLEEMIENSEQQKEEEKGRQHRVRGNSANANANSSLTIDDDYPNFTRHGSKALLPKYLSRDIYNQLKNKSTSNGVTLEDMIRSGVSLPNGAKPPRGLAGVYAGDAECYETFKPLLLPLIYDHLDYRRRRETIRQRMTGRREKQQQQQTQQEEEEQQQQQPDRSQGIPNHPHNRRLQRHESNLNYKQLITQKLDTTGQYILYTRMRLARSISGFRFAPCMSRTERRRIENLIKDCIQDFKNNNNNNGSGKGSSGSSVGGSSSGGGYYVSISEMTNAQHDDLIQRRILFHDPDAFAISAGLGRDWPDGRGIYCDTWRNKNDCSDSSINSGIMPAVIIWCNAEDHLWIISNSKGGDVQEVFTKLSQAAYNVENALTKRGYAFVEDKRLGFLNTSPEHVGTALRASVYVKLVRLSRQPGFFDLIQRLRLEASSDYAENDKRFTGIYDIGSVEALGKSEVELINIMIKGVGVLIDLEKRLESGEDVDLATIPVKRKGVQ